MLSFSPQGLCHTPIIYLPVITSRIREARPGTDIVLFLACLMIDGPFAYLKCSVS